MARKTVLTASRVYSQVDGELTLDTEAKSFNALPAAYDVAINALSIYFPSFATNYGVGGGAAYAWDSPFPPDTSGGITFWRERCVSWATILGQDWGPSAPSPYTIADVVIGSVPAGTDYLETRAYLTRTVTPPDILGVPWPTDIVSGYWEPLVGNSRLVEQFGGVKRHFELLLSGTDIVLRRTQSVASVDALGGSLGGLRTHHRQRLDSGGTGYPYRIRETDANHCSFTANERDWTSTYTAWLLITPCRHT